MHVHIKATRAFGHVNEGLGHHLSNKQVKARAPLPHQEKRGSLSLFLFGLPLSLLQVDKGSLSLAWVHEAKLCF